MGWESRRWARFVDHFWNQIWTSAPGFLSSVSHFDPGTKSWKKDKIYDKNKNDEGDDDDGDDGDDDDGDDGDDDDGDDGDDDDGNDDEV